MVQSMLAHQISSLMNLVIRCYLCLSCLYLLSCIRQQREILNLLSELQLFSDCAAISGVGIILEIADCYR